MSMSRIYKLILFTICIFFLQGVFAQNIVINEFMSSNYEYLLDYNGDDSDWIEIYNKSDVEIDLSDYFLSDNPENLSKWHFPEIQILPDSFLVVFASGKDTIYPNGEIHTNFSMKRTGENLLLNKGESIIQIIDSVFLEQNQSYGCISDGNDEYIVFDVATAGAENVFVEIEKVMFSHSGGIYDSCFLLNLSNYFPENKIYYTLDGSMPTTSDVLFNEAIFIGSQSISPNNYDLINTTPYEDYYIPTERPINSIVVRAAAFDSLGNLASKVMTSSYFIGELGVDHGKMPLISISIEYKDLFSYNSGIYIAGKNFNPEKPTTSGNYYQRGPKWEKLVNVEFYEPDNKCAFNHLAGLRTHGGAVRLFRQKGLRLYADSEYGRNKFYHKIFDYKDITEFKRLILKPYMSSWYGCGIEEYVCSQIAYNTKASSIAYRPVVLYINGVYWGIYYVGERIDEFYIESNYEVDKDSVVIVENWSGETTDGVSDEFSDLYNYIAENDMSIASNYYYVSSKIDINNLIDYLILEIFIDNNDWPVQNMKCWKSVHVNSKWQWIFFDGDAGLNVLKHNMFKHILSEDDQDRPTNEYSTLVFRKLFKNQSFYYQFNARLQELLTTELSHDRTVRYLQQCSDYLDTEIHNQSICYGEPLSFEKWVDFYENINNFLENRACEVERHYKKTLGGELNIPKCQETHVGFSDLQVYPNPNDGNFEVVIEPNKSTPCLISLTNYLGQNEYVFNDILLEGENVINFKDIDIGPGIYLLSVFVDGEFISTKILIQ